MSSEVETSLIIVRGHFEIASQIVRDSSTTLGMTKGGSPRHDVAPGMAIDESDMPGSATSATVICDEPCVYSALEGAASSATP